MDHQPRSTTKAIWHATIALAALAGAALLRATEAARPGAPPGGGIALIQLSRLLAGRRIAAVAAMLVGAGALAIFDRDGSDTRHPFDDDPVRALAEIGQKLEAADGGSSSLAPNRPTTALPQHSLLSRGYSPIGDGPTVPAAGQPISGLASVEEMTERLARRLEATPTDIEGWRMLGWSYAAIDRHADSARAYAKYPLTTVFLR